MPAWVAGLQFLAMQQDSVVPSEVWNQLDIYMFPNQTSANFQVPASGADKFELLLPPE